ncbi:MAG: hypothetical protein VCE43_10030, partial [Myxococcota bacterium]
WDAACRGGDSSRGAPLAVGDRSYPETICSRDVIVPVMAPEAIEVVSVEDVSGAASADTGRK